MGVSLSSLRGRRILVVEDEYFIADDLAHAIETAGAEVVGPASTGEAAFSLLDGPPIDLAVLDINLAGEINFTIADELARRNIPFVFATGYDAATIPARHANRQRWQKPFEMAELVRALGE